MKAYSWVPCSMCLSLALAVVVGCDSAVPNVDAVDAQEGAPQSKAFAARFRLARKDSWGPGEVKIDESRLPSSIEVMISEPLDASQATGVVIPLEISASGDVVLEADGPFEAIIASGAQRAFRTAGRFHHKVTGRELRLTTDMVNPRLVLERPRGSVGVTHFTVDLPKWRGDIPASITVLQREMTERLLVDQGQDQNRDVAVLLDQWGTELRSRASSPDFSEDWLRKRIEQMYGDWQSNAVVPDPLKDPQCFAVGMSSFAIPTSRLDGSDPVAILRAGSGHCRPQAHFARYVIEVVAPELSPVVVGSDSARNGHQLCVTTNAICDGSAGVVIPVSRARWEGLSDRERIHLVEEYALVLPSFVFFDPRRAMTIPEYGDRPAEDIVQEFIAYLPLITFSNVER